MSKALPENNKIFDVMTTTSSCILGSVWVKKNIENRKFFVFHPICLKFGIGGNFEVLITERKPKLKLENYLSKKLVCLASTEIDFQVQYCTCTFNSIY